jgi:hypothetical protein
MSIGGVGQSSSAYSPPVSAGGGASSASGAASIADGAGTKAEFLKWANMTPAQRMRANILSSMGLDEAKVAAMPLAERQKVEQKVREMIEAKLKHGDSRPGQLFDQKA